MDWNSIWGEVISGTILLGIGSVVDGLQDY